MILNETFLRGYAKTQINTAIRESYSSLRHFDEKERYDIFISHSSLDSHLTIALYNIFEQCGFHVYIDYEDNELNPQMVSSSTGEQLRTRMQNSKCLAYIATSNTPTSKWCPWELGYYDGISNGKCCILPINLGERKGFKGQEYLGMYPYLEYEKYSGKDEYTFWIIDPNDGKKYNTLENWIKGHEIYWHEK